MRFLLGGYGPDRGGIAEGIGVLDAGDAGSPLAGGALAFRGVLARAESPSWVERHPSLGVVYAALEGRGSVAAFARVDEKRFAPLGAAVEVGDSVCHCAVAPDGSSLIASCYGDGRVVRLAIDAEGRLGSPTVGAAAVDPFGDPFGGVVGGPSGAGEGGGEGGGEDAERASHAHSAVFLPDGRIATTDLGFDLVRVWRRGSGLELDHEVVLPRGTGPRHMVAHPSGYLYVVTEFTAEVFVLRADGSGRFGLLGGVPLGGLDGDTGAELAAGLDDEFVYAGLRGSDTISVLRVRGDGGVLEPVGVAESGVEWPRHHAVVRDEILVGGQRSNTIASLTIDTRSGVPGRVRQRVEAPSPTRILPLR